MITIYKNGAKAKFAKGCKRTLLMSVQNQHPFHKLTLYPIVIGDADINYEVSQEELSKRNAIELEFTNPSSVISLINQLKYIHKSMLNSYNKLGINEE